MQQNTKKKKKTIYGDMPIVLTASRAYIIQFQIVFKLLSTIDTVASVCCVCVWIMDIPQSAAVIAYSIYILWPINNTDKQVFKIAANIVRLERKHSDSVELVVRWEQSNRHRHTYTHTHKMIKKKQKNKSAQSALDKKRRRRRPVSSLTQYRDNRINGSIYT